MRFAHIADTHIRNLKYHKEYGAVFEKLYSKLKTEKIDYIIHCGDIAHTKTQISPEFVKMCSDFFKNLADIAPTYIILGNHDGNLRNSSRLDALSPIVDSLNHKDLHLLRDSGETKLKNNFVINVLSVFDRDNWLKPTDSSAVNIALYHGAICNSKTDVGWIMEHGEDNINIFDDFDYAFLGDIHKTNQALDKEGRVRYAGSTVQQNHGETNDKGFLVWDIKDKSDFVVNHHVLKNPKPFITIELTKKGRMPKNITVPAGARLRLVSNSSLSLDIIRRAVDIAKHRFKPEVITFLSRADGIGSVEELTDSLVKEDLRSLEVQEELISEYLKEYEVSDDLLENIYSLNRKYNTLAEQEEEISRNINWRLKNIKWDNLFNYGQNNEINFSDVNGIVGIFGKNFSGKSSIVDSLLYTLYNSTSKNVRKNLNFINQNKETCLGEVNIDIGHNTYVVQRTSEKYVKRLKGEETLEAKTDVEFFKKDKITGTEQSLNGLSRNDTDKNIRKVFGTLEDFLLTSMASQLGSLSFISEGSTRRKEILAKFLDLEFFEKKFKMAKEDSADIKSSIKRLEERNFDEEIEAAREESAINEILTGRKKIECERLKKQIDLLSNSLTEMQNSINSIPTEIINIGEINEQILNYTDAVSALKNDNKNHNQHIEDKKEFLNKIDRFIEEFDVTSYEKKKSFINSSKDNIERFIKELEVLNLGLSHQEGKIKLLDEVPCGEQYPSCKFIKDAHAAKTKLTQTKVSIKNLTIDKTNTEEEIKKLNPDKIFQYLEKYDEVVGKKNNFQRDLDSYKLSIEKNKTKIFKIKNILVGLETKKAEYDDNRETIENLEELLKNKRKIEEKHKNLKLRFEDCYNETLELYKTDGSIEQRMTALVEQKEEFKRLQTEFSSMDLYLKSMHTNGISYDIIKKKLPLINEEVAKILTNIVDFQVLFEEDGRKLDVLIKHPKHDPRPIEMGSGAEKTIAAMAIRLALLNVSTLPKSDIFILDEPGTALDEENMEGFTRILDMIKTHFKTVILISHLDSLKDCVDQQIIIEKDEKGYAHVKY
jgi:DNA repair exonuclease SbcCD ATPase subunit/DNA repair exonuclease SbcCD nuclease subunit